MTRSYFSFGITGKEFKLLTLTILLALCGGLGLDIHLASLPHIMLELNTNKQSMQQSITFYMLGGAFSVLVYGPLSDKIGRKPVVFFGLILFCVTNFLMITVHSVQYFLILRLLQGVGSGVSWGLARIIAADVMQNERLAAIGSYFTLFLSLSPLFAPVLGGYIQHWFNWQANFIVLGVFISIVLISFIIFFEETNQHKDSAAFALKPLLRNYASFFKNRFFVGAVLLGGISLSINIIYITLSSFIFQEQFHTSPIMFGWLTAIVGVSGAVTKVISPVFILKSKNHKIMNAGIMLILTSGIFLLIPSAMSYMNIPLVLIGASIAMVALTLMGTTAMSMALSPFHDKRGSAGALFASFQLFLAFALSGLVAILPYSGTSVLAVIYTLLGLLGIALNKVCLNRD
ncbi:MAG: multidrug effflux MFS transporter [Legionella sp.]|nr:multidrug effflux MFS transporter [Legionella sp.]